MELERQVFWLQVVVGGLCAFAILTAIAVVQILMAP